MKRKKSRHHVVPRSRQNGKPAIVLIDDEDHKNFHLVFGNLTPNECVAHLVNYYFAGNWDFVYEALKQQQAS